jgi:FMN reductase (NADPH)
MSQVLDVINGRKSIRVYQDKKIEEDAKDEILRAAMKAPTAGNMMLYSIIDVTDEKIKEKLSQTCDNQAFIAKAPMVLVFLADYQKWNDYFAASDVKGLCREKNIEYKKPEEGDFLLSICDALIAAENAVIAAEGLGIGSCYIGDIIENYEIHKELFNLPDYVFPIAMLCLGYGTEQQKDRQAADRFDKKFVIFENKYNKLDEKDLEEMFKDKKCPKEYKNFGQFMYHRKFGAAFSKEMTRSAREMMKIWQA